MAARECISTPTTDFHFQIFSRYLKKYEKAGGVMGVKREESDERENFFLAELTL